MTFHDTILDAIVARIATETTFVTVTKKIFNTDMANDMPRVDVSLQGLRQVDRINFGAEFGTFEQDLSIRIRASIPPETSYDAVVYMNELNSKLFDILSDYNYKLIIGVGSANSGVKDLYFESYTTPQANNESGFVETTHFYKIEYYNNFNKFYT